MRENTIKMDDLGGTPNFENTHINPYQSILFNSQLQYVPHLPHAWYYIYIRTIDLAPDY